jgi:hypothetical protein
MVTFMLLDIVKERMIIMRIILQLAITRTVLNDGGNAMTEPTIATT